MSRLLVRKRHVLAATQSSSGATLPFTFLRSVTAAPGPNGGITAPIDTTGAKFILLQASAFGSFTISDSKGNTWLSSTLVSTASGNQQFFFVVNPIVGTGHTFTITGSAIYPVIIVVAFTGVINSVLHSQQDGIVFSSPNQTTAGVTPVVNNSLIVAGFASNTITSITVNQGLTQITVLGVANINITGSIGYKVQSPAAFINPTWTFAGDTAAALKLVDFTPS